MIISGITHDRFGQSVCEFSTSNHPYVADPSNSFVLASTQELHEKIAQLATRVRQLEDSLRASHSQLSTEQHPLLTEELLKIKAPLQRDTSQPKSPSAPAVKEEDNNDEVGASGSLVIGESGKAKFYGQTASSWVRINSLVPIVPPDLWFILSVIPRSTSGRLFIEVHLTLDSTERVGRG